MDATRIDFASEQPARWLVYYNMRFFNWLVFPALLLLIVIVQLRCIAAAESAAAAALVVLCSPLAWLHLRIRQRSARFWVEFNHHILSHGRNVLSGEAQVQWYATAAPVVRTKQSHGVHRFLLVLVVWRLRQV